MLFRSGRVVIPGLFFQHDSDTGRYEDLRYGEGYVGPSLDYRKLEKLERAEGQDLGLRVFIGRKQAIVSTSDRSRQIVDPLVERAVAMAKAAPEDPFCGLAEPGDIARSLPELDLIDPVEPEAALLVERARAAEDAALEIGRAHV